MLASACSVPTKYEMGKSEILPVLEGSWYPFGRCSHLVNEMLTNYTLDKMQ